MKSISKNSSLLSMISLAVLIIITLTSLSLPIQTTATTTIDITTSNPQPGTSTSIDIKTNDSQVIYESEDGEVIRQEVSTGSDANISINGQTPTTNQICEEDNEFIKSLKLKKSQLSQVIPQLQNHSQTILQMLEDSTQNTLQICPQTTPTTALQELKESKNDLDKAIIQLNQTLTKAINTCNSDTTHLRVQRQRLIQRIANYKQTAQNLTTQLQSQLQSCQYI